MQKNPMFSIRTVSGQVYTQGYPNTFCIQPGIENLAASLESFDTKGGYVVLTYTDGMTVSFPERQIEFILEAHRS